MGGFSDSFAVGVWRLVSSFASFGPPLLGGKLRLPGTSSQGGRVTTPSWGRLEQVSELVVDPKLVKFDCQFLREVRAHGGLRVRSL